MITGQEVVAYGLVGGAAYYVVRELWGQLAPLRKSAKEGATPCDTCGACAGLNKPKDQPLISLSMVNHRRTTSDSDSSPLNED
jgi:hypothetical protein